jgi:tRNA A37 threonylcarbamoyladenosine synthetase subunit TsaC/SUA5/YrdC
MPTEHILALLIAERDKLNRAIEVLQGPTKLRGRPPKNPLPATVPSTPEAAQPTKKPRRKFTAAQRKQQAERMKAFWAAKKTASGKPRSKASKKTAKAAQRTFTIRATFSDPSRRSTARQPHSGNRIFGHRRLGPSTYKYRPLSGKLTWRRLPRTDLP